VFATHTLPPAATDADAPAPTLASDSSIVRRVPGSIRSADDVSL
jgi:hypothetical protein